MKQKKKIKKAPVIISIVVILFLILRIASCALSSDPGAIVSTTSAYRGDIQESISTSGTVESGEVKVVFSSVNGKISDVMVDSGDMVKAGDLLISFDMEDMERSLEQAALQHTVSSASYQGIMADNSKSQAKLSEANTNLAVLEQQIADHTAYLKKLQAELSRSQRETSNALASEAYQLSSRQTELESELANLTGGIADGQPADPKDADRVQAIRKELKELVSQMAQNNYQQSVALNSDYVAELEDKIADVQERIAEFKEYKIEMESQKSSSEMAVLSSYDKQQHAANNDLADLTYEEARRQYDEAARGVVADFAGVVTECSAVPGAAVSENMQLLTLKSSENVLVTFQASRSDVEKLEVGQTVDVTVSGHSYRGEVNRISHVASRNESNTPMVGVEVQIIDPDENIILGLDARLTIYTKKSENALLIPVEAVNSDREGDFLYVVENGMVVKKPIVCGISSDTYTEVTEGITEADQIILMSYTTLEEGMAVTILPN
ncbi:MAG: efflux RND transporter periplasmic adaptor subunit [Acetatifactor sp.]|nr:efflux RND transporter periplasmic adaptor subunit [Acetatifactor sp.]